MSTVKAKAPNVRTACLWQTIATNTSAIQLPRLESYKTYRYDSNASVAVQPDTWSQDNVSFISPNLVRTVWIDSARDIDAVTAGLVILAPLMISNDTTRSALGCSIDARWDESHHVQSDGPLDTAISADVVGPRHDDSGGSGFLPANNSDWKNIKATMDWLEALTPTVPYLSLTLDLTSPASTIANLLMSTGHTQILPVDSVENESVSILGIRYRDLLCRGCCTCGIFPTAGIGRLLRRRIKSRHTSVHHLHSPCMAQFGHMS